MKTKNRSLLMFGFALLIVFFSSCKIVENFDTLPVNFGLNVVLNMSGTTTNVSESGSIDLGTSSTYQEYRDKIESLKLLEAAFRTVSVSPTDLSGNVTMIFEFGDNIVIKGLGDIKPSDYTVTPLIIQFTADELTKINNYLNATKSPANPVFKATILATGMADGQKSMVISVDVVFEGITKF